MMPASDEDIMEGADAGPDEEDVETPPPLPPPRCFQMQCLFPGCSNTMPSALLSAARGPIMEYYPLCLRDDCARDHQWCSYHMWRGRCYRHCLPMQRGEVIAVLGQAAQALDDKLYEARMLHERMMQTGHDMSGVLGRHVAENDADGVISE